MADFEITSNDGTIGGEIDIRALSERAGQYLGGPVSHAMVFKSASDAREFVQAAQSNGFTFTGIDILRHII